MTLCATAVVFAGVEARSISTSGPTAAGAPVLNCTRDADCAERWGANSWCALPVTGYGPGVMGTCTRVAPLCAGYVTGFLPPEVCVGGGRSCAADARRAIMRRAVSLVTSAAMGPRARAVGV